MGQIICKIAPRKFGIKVIRVNRLIFNGYGLTTLNFFSETVPFRVAKCKNLTTTTKSIANAAVFGSRQNIKAAGSALYYTTKDHSFG